MRVRSGARAFAFVVIAATVTALSATLAGQAGEKFSARLGWVPISGAERANVTGKGSASAVLTGTRLAITGSFEGLAAPATIARLHNGVAKGARGPMVSDLTVTKGTNGTSGTISGSVDLTPDQLDGLKRGRLYIQVHSEKGVAPDGANLWGWLLR